MRCHECQTANAPHTVTYSTIAIPGPALKFYDEQDRPHFHDSTKMMTYMVCSNGHRWEHVGRNACPTCGKPVDVET